MYRDRKEKGGCIVLGGEWLKENEDWLVDGKEFFSGVDKNVLQVW
jgi:hypothetical protein